MYFAPHLTINYGNLQNYRRNKIYYLAHIFTEFIY